MHNTNNKFTILHSEPKMKVLYSVYYGKSVLFPVFLVVLVSLIHPTNAFERNENAVYSTVLNKNRTQYLYWSLKDNNKNHTLHCELPEDVDAKSVSFEWVHVNGSEINDTDVHKKNDGITISLEFPHITYEITGTYQCKSTRHTKDDTYSRLNYTNVVIFVQATRPQGILVMMSIVAAASVIVCFIVLRKVGV